LDSCFESIRECGAPKDKIPVGAMGWLLTCRQAYVEGIDVLYGTNTMHINGAAIVNQLPKFLVPARLATIRAVELVWSLKPWADTYIRTRAKA
jgi:hypothetical protein